MESSRRQLARVAILIADIGGYTRFLRMPRVSLLHAQSLVDMLLDALMRTPALGLMRGRVIGDATHFYYVPDNATARRALIDAAPRLLASFVHEQARIDAARICDCSACEGVLGLRLKFVAHAGEAVMTRDRDGGLDLAGPPIILAHRLLKNAAPYEEYLLMTDEAVSEMTADERERAIGLEEAVEGFGPTRIRVLPIERSEVAAAVADELRATAERLDRWRHLGRLESRALKHLVRRDPTEYRNLPRVPQPGELAAAGAH